MDNETKGSGISPYTREASLANPIRWLATGGCMHACPGRVLVGGLVRCKASA